MTATDELRRLLDERGVEWKDHHHDNRTWWSDDNNVGWFAEGRPAVTGSYVKIEAVLTPEQAIAATMGRGTCKNIAPGYLDFLCSECGFVHYIDDNNCTGDGNEWKYCPNCGKVVEQ